VRGLGPGTHEDVEGLDRAAAHVVSLLEEERAAAGECRSRHAKSCVFRAFSFSWHAKSCVPVLLAFLEFGHGPLIGRPCLDE
jgi:hypothetical protein